MLEKYKNLLLNRAFFKLLSSFAHSKSSAMGARVHLARDILEYQELKEHTALLAHAHIMYQKYFFLKKLDPALPPAIGNNIKNVIWEEEDGADSKNLVTKTLFNNAFVKVTASVRAIIDVCLETSVAKEFLNKFNIDAETGLVKKGKIKFHSKTPEIFRKKQEDSKTSSKDLKRAKSLSPDTFNDRLKKGSFFSKKDSRNLNVKTKLLEPRYWSNEEVVQWVKKIGLETYCEAFKQHNITGYVLYELNKEDIEELINNHDDQEIFFRKRDFLENFMESLKK